MFVNYNNNWEILNIFKVKLVILFPFNYIWSSIEGNLLLFELLSKTSGSGWLSSNLVGGFDSFLLLFFSSGPELFTEGKNLADSNCGAGAINSKHKRTNPPINKNIEHKWWNVCLSPKNNKEKTNMIIALPNVVLIKPNISVIILGILDGIIKDKTMNVIKKQEYNSSI